MKLAEREIYQNATGEYPVLLLDDVLSELDPGGRNLSSTASPGGRCSSPAVRMTGCRSCWAGRCST